MGGGGRWRGEGEGGTGRGRGLFIFSWTKNKGEAISSNTQVVYTVHQIQTYAHIHSDLGTPAKRTAKA